jgi:hypothetical protein
VSGAPARAASGQAGASLASVEIQVLQNPSPFVADGRAHLLYELHVTSFQSTPLTLQALEVAAVGDPPTPIARFEGPELAGMIVPAGAAAPPDDPLTLQPAVRNMVFLWLHFDSTAAVPIALRHTLTFEPRASGEPAHLSVLPRMEVLPLEPVVIGPPVHGERWLAANAVSNVSGHRREPDVVNGHLYFSQRYAVDLIQVGSDGLAYRGDPSHNENWLCYGAELLAVADGVVVEVRDGIPENVPLEAPAVPMTLDTVAGNYVLLDLGNGRYGGYAHFIPGSIRVQPGDRVRRGDVLGLLGNSGQSSAPHLHFHVTNGPSFLGADGVPYAFDRVRVRKARLVPLEGTNFRVDVLSDAPREAVLELVLNDDLLDFGPP